MVVCGFRIGTIADMEHLCNVGPRHWDSKVFVEWRSIAREWWSFGLGTEGLVEYVFNCVLLGGEPLRAIKPPTRLAPAQTPLRWNATTRSAKHAISGGFL